MHPRVVITLLLAGVLALAAVVLVARTEGVRAPAARDVVTVEGGGSGASAFAGSTLPDGVRAPGFSLENQEGERISMRDFRGRPVAVTFLYTQCEESCPPQAQQIKGALDQLGHDIPALAIAVDPDRDTPESAQRFLTEQRMTGRMDFVLGSREELKPLWEGYAIQPQTAKVEHQARITLVDADGFQRVGFPLEVATPERIAHDIRLLEAEAASG
jgi:protein SCO1